MGTCKNERKTLLTKPFCLVLLDKNLRHNTDCKSLHPPGSVLTCEAPTEVSQWDCHCEIYRQNLNVVWIHLNFYFYVVINSQVLTRNHRPHALLLILLQWWQPANLYYSITTSILTWTQSTNFIDWGLPILTCVCACVYFDQCNFITCAGLINMKVYKQTKKKEWQRDCTYLSHLWVSFLTQ